MPLKTGDFKRKFGTFGIMADMQRQIVEKATCRPVCKNEIFLFLSFKMVIHGLTFIAMISILKTFITDNTLEVDR